MSTTSSAERTNPIHDSLSERRSYLYVNVRAAYGRAAIQTAILLNGGASVALLAFLGNLAIAHQSKGVTGNYATFKTAFVCFVIGVMLAASANVIAFLIQNVAIDHPSEAEGRLGRRLRTIGIGTVVAFFFSPLESRWRPPRWKIWFVRWISLVELRLNHQTGSRRQTWPCEASQCGGDTNRRPRSL